MKNKKILFAIFGILISIFLMGSVIHYEQEKSENPLLKETFQREKRNDTIQMEKPDMPEENEIPEDIPNHMEDGEFNHLKESIGSSNKNFSKVSFVLIFAILCLLGISIGYMIEYLNAKDKSHIFENSDKKKIFLLEVFLFALLGTLFFSIFGTTDNFRKQEEVEKEDVQLEAGVLITNETILLDDYKSNVWIKQGGIYSISGTLKEYSLIIDTDETVMLKLNNVTIESANTAAILNLGTSELTLYLEEGSQNMIKDHGSSNYDGAIYSNGNLIIDGKGSLDVTGNQTDGEGIATENADITIYDGVIKITSKDDGLNAGGDGGTITIHGGSIYIDAEGDGIDSNKNCIMNGGTIFTIGSEHGGNAGIDTDEGYVINGGIVVALCMDMAEYPKETSTQSYISFELLSGIEDEIFSIKDESNKELISFRAPKGFKTAIISTPEIVNTTYSLYSGGNHEGKYSQGIYEKGLYIGGTKIVENKINK